MDNIARFDVHTEMVGYTVMVSRTIEFLRVLAYFRPIYRWLSFYAKKLVYFAFVYSIKTAAFCENRQNASR